jgi:hypothetical protein
MNVTEKDRGGGTGRRRKRGRRKIIRKVVSDEQ